MSRECAKACDPSARYSGSIPVRHHHLSIPVDSLPTAPGRERATRTRCPTGDARGPSPLRLGTIAPRARSLPHDTGYSSRLPYGSGHAPPVPPGIVAQSLSALSVLSVRPGGAGNYPGPCAVVCLLLHC